MANEQTVTIRYEVANGNFKHNIMHETQRYDQASALGGGPGVVSATTTAASISFGAATPGYVFLRNNSTGEKVTLQTTGGDSFAELAPGQVGLIPKGADTWQYKATTAGGTPNIDIRGFST